MIQALTTEQRLNETARLLARAFIRLHTDNDSQSDLPDQDQPVLLDKPASQCLYDVSANPVVKEALWLKK